MKDKKTIKGAREIKNKEQVLREAITQALENMKLPKNKKVPLEPILEKAELKSYMFLGDYYLVNETYEIWKDGTVYNTKGGDSPQQIYDLREELLGVKK